jgi:hypothetical protein
MSRWEFGILAGLVLVAGGCISKRVLDHQLPLQTPGLALVVYAENPAELLETGKDDAGQMGYQTFADWLDSAMASGCDKYKYWYFEPKTVITYAQEDGAKIISYPVRPITGSYQGPMTLSSFPESTLPILFLTGEDLGATNIVKVKLLHYERNESYRDEKKLKGNFVRIEMTARIIAYQVGHLEAVYDGTVSLAEDRSMLFRDVYGGKGNVKRDMATAIIKALNSSEMEKLNS